MAVNLVLLMVLHSVDKTELLLDYTVVDYLVAMLVSYLDQSLVTSMVD